MGAGKVYLVGAGPWDPQLITVRGLKLIRKADVIIYDFLVNKELLTFAKKDAELICAGKSHLHHSMEQDEINKLLVEKAERANVVVRLKNGDPFVFGRGAEEAVYLAEKNISYEVIPGVSSATAVPAVCGVPLTHRDYASSAAIITGHRKEDSEVEFVNSDTLVFLMGVANLKRIIKNLVEKGKPPDTPCLLIEKGTSNDEKVIQGNLGNILEKSKRGNISPPAVFVVGEVVNLRSILNQTKGSAVPNILFTGINPKRFREEGKILHQPMIKIVPLDDYSEVEQEIEGIDKYDWIIFTSQYGVEYFLNILSKAKKRMRNINICAIGKTTAGKLKKLNMRVDCVPEEESSKGIIKSLRNFDLEGKSILIPRSNIAGGYLPGALRKMGASVRTIPVYRNIKLSGLKKVNLSQVDEIIFTSPSTVKNFMEEYKSIPKGIRMKCIGDVTLSRLENYGFSGEIIRK